MSGRTGSLAALGEKENIERASERAKDREQRGDSSRDCGEARLIVKIIDRGEFFYDVVTQNRSAAERSLASPDSPLSRRDAHPMRMLFSPSSFSRSHVVKREQCTRAAIKLHFSATFLYLRRRRIRISMQRWTRRQTMSLWSSRRFTSAGATYISPVPSFFSLCRGVNENWFSGYHDYIVRSAIQSDNIQALLFLARDASIRAEPRALLIHPSSHLR